MIGILFSDWNPVSDWNPLPHWNSLPDWNSLPSWSPLAILGWSTPEASTNTEGISSGEQLTTLVWLTLELSSAGDSTASIEEGTTTICSSCYFATAVLCAYVGLYLLVMNFVTDGAVKCIVTFLFGCSLFWKMLMSTSNLLVVLALAAVFVPPFVANLVCAVCLKTELTHCESAVHVKVATNKHIHIALWIMGYQSVACVAVAFAFIFGCFAPSLEELETK